MPDPFRTDLAAEALEHLGGAGAGLEGVSLRREELGGAPLLAVEISGREAAARLGKPTGKYYTLELPAHFRRADTSFAALAGAVAELIRRCGVPEEGGVLVAALGNPDITPDALGPLCAAQVLATRHLKLSGDALWRDFSSVSLCRPGVLGTSGVESAEQIRAICAAVKPALVIVVDALAGAEADRLCRSVQVCDSGISPGAGVCNDRARIDRALLGVPVTAVGVPTVTDAAAPGEEGARGLFVTPRDIDSSVRACARIIAYGINLALHPCLSVEEIDGLVG
ncbi:MAG: GPR endopeptidase [Oscillospiraceae bacterium]|nr:GPR endopeptidase [Oscillospiraceae bacterium]